MPTHWRVQLLAVCCMAPAGGPHKGLCSNHHRGAIVQSAECERWMDDGPLGQRFIFLRPAAGNVRIAWTGPAHPGRAREGHRRGRRIRVSASRRAGCWLAWVRLDGHPLYAGPAPTSTLVTTHAWAETVARDALAALPKSAD